MSAPRAFITGIGGFAGPYLARDLVEAGTEVHGLVQRGRQQRATGLAGVTLHEGDIRDSNGLAEILRDVAPDAIYHLAGKSHVGLSWGQPLLYYEINAIGTVAVLEAARSAAPQSIVVHASTAEVYGRSRQAAPIAETHQAHPQSPYAASKLCAEICGRQLVDSGLLRVVSVRPFNFAGPGQDPIFVCSDFARQVARAEAGLTQPVIAVGNLDVVRDFTDVRDVARGFARAATLGANGGTYNLCSGHPTTVRAILETLVAQAHIPIEVRVDRTRFRRAEIPVFVGDGSRAAKELGWCPKIPLDATLSDTLSYWRDRVRTGQVPVDAPDV